MGEARRRKAILGELYGKSSSSTLKKRSKQDYVVTSSFKWRRVSNSTDLQVAACEHIPIELATSLALAIDSEQLVPSAQLSIEGWPYNMRCILNSYPAMQWVNQFCEGVPKKHYAAAFSNAIRLLAMAVIDVDLDSFYNDEYFDKDYAEEWKQDTEKFEFADLHSRLSAYFRSEHHRSSTDLRNSLQMQLELEGHQVSVVNCEPCSKMEALMKETEQSIKEEDTQELIKARVLQLSEVIALDETG